MKIPLTPDEVTKKWLATVLEQDVDVLHVRHDRALETGDMSSVFRAELRTKGGNSVVRRLFIKARFFA